MGHPLVGQQCEHSASDRPKKPAQNGVRTGFEGIDPHDFYYCRAIAMWMASSGETR